MDSIPFPSSYCSFTYDGHHYVAFEVRRSRIFEKTNVSKSDLNVSSVSKSDLNVPKNSGFTFLEEYTFATKEVREKVESAIMMTMGGNILQSESFEAIMSESNKSGSNRNESNKSDWTREWRLLLKDSVEKIGSRNYSFDPKTFCTFTFRGCLYIAFKCVKGHARQPAREHPDVEIVRRKMRKLSRTDFFGAQRSSSRAESQRTNSRKGSKEDDFQSVNSACSLGLRSSLSVSSNQRKVTPEVVFNEKETLAPIEMRVKISEAVEQVSNNGTMLHQNLYELRDMVRKSIGGAWFILPRSRMDSIRQEFEYIQSTFCSFTFHAHQYIAFEHLRRRHASGDSSSSRSDLNVSLYQAEVEFNGKETFAPLKIKKDISAVFKNLAKKGQNVAQNGQNLAQSGQNLANYQLVKSELEKKLPGNWFIQLREKLPLILENVSLKDQIVSETFCSFTFGGNHFIAFRREDGAGYGILMGKILQFGLGIEDGATGGKPIPAGSEPKLKPGSGLNVSRFENMVDSSDEEEEIFGAQTWMI